ncbi:3-deoxy-D-manno-octulosonic acid kinase [Candidimonas sp. SYP-B2681]|uniref:3-deoxy-D-manno-octulosonic acid kinase n=1 Tax=Candidimonas sp. SYP-B2681 TaxID=2497686 RepID=UPI000F8661C6|nr:3-deoxy-D-manno-octulosonic acid kinase [Candidimonas sp. SYP-B2681]
MRYDANRISAPGMYLFDPVSPQLQVAAVSHGGRRAAWFVKGEFGDGVLRHYRRGGLMARLSSDRYIWTGPARTRSFAEFDLLHFMHDRGLPVPRPIAAAYWRHGFTYRAAIVVERIFDVQPLANMLDAGNHEKVANAIYAMHEAGVWHSDLNAYNILLDKEGKAWLIDFDKCKRLTLSLERRSANLLRLRRSLVKVAGTAGLSWWGELNHAYALLTRVKGLL